MNLTTSILSLGTALILISGCTPHATVSAVKPSESPKTDPLKTLSIGFVENDTVFLTQHLQTALSHTAPYFSMVPTISAQGVVNATVTTADTRHSVYYVTRTVCLDKECHKTRPVREPCRTKTSSLGVHFTVSQPQTGELLFASDEFDSLSQSHCPGEPIQIDSDAQHFNTLAAEISERFAHRLVPSTQTYRIELIEEPDTVFPDQGGVMFEEAVELITKSRMAQAISVLESLSAQFPQSGAVQYNLGVAYESIGKYQEAKTRYLNASQIDTLHSALINDALARNEQNIEDNRALSVQIKP